MTANEIANEIVDAAYKIHKELIKNGITSIINGLEEEYY